MNKTIMSLVIVLILIFHLVAMILDYKIGKTFFYISCLNMIVAASILVLWAVKNLSIQQHYLEFREICALYLEACIFIFAFYSVIGFYNNILKVINYIGFGLHFLALLGILIFILLFKINKLF